MFKYSELHIDPVVDVDIQREKLFLVDSFP